MAVLLLAGGLQPYLAPTARPLARQKAVSSGNLVEVALADRPFVAAPGAVVGGPDGSRGGRGAAAGAAEGAGQLLPACGGRLGGDPAGLLLAQAAKATARCTSAT